MCNQARLQFASLPDPTALALPEEVLADVAAAATGAGATPPATRGKRPVCAVAYVLSLRCSVLLDCV